MLKKETLRDQRDFKRVYNKGKSKRSKNVILIYYENNLDYSRIGIVASKKVGNSVQRNRARRLIKEALRSVPQIKTGYDIVFVAKVQINESTLEEVKKGIFGILREAELFKKTRK